LRITSEPKFECGQRLHDVRFKLIDVNLSHIKDRKFHQETYNFVSNHS
jgi:hypothetical protein